MVILIKTQTHPTEEMSQGRLGLVPKLWINNKGNGFRGRSESNWPWSWAGVGWEARPKGWSLNGP